MKIRNPVPSVFSHSTLNRVISARLALALAAPAVALSGCYVMPVGQDSSGNPYYAYSPLPIPPVVSSQGAARGAHPAAVPGGPIAATLGVKLYPINDLANQTGVLTGQVTNMMNGQGRFAFNYQGETLVGEATRVANDERRGIASAYGGRGTFARCEYQMSTPLLGAGTCTFSNGAQYQLHVGS
ncbi:MAG TPA: hypothetical protein VFO57_01770 [Burkholderiales bacterium]|nr:hypothetical protein [Burkholderiales bacterium]